MISRPIRKIFELDYQDLGTPKYPFDPLRLLFEFAPIFIKAARNAREKEAESHRQVRVGALAVMNNVEAKKVRAYIGFNKTPYSGAPKHCAEMRAFGRGISNGYSQREFVITVGPDDPDIIESINQVRTPTLYPCDPCTALLEPATVALTVSENDDSYEVHTGTELTEMRHRLHSLTKKQRRNGLITSGQLIQDPEFTGLTSCGDRYVQLTSDIGDLQKEDLRQKRAEIAVTLLRELG